MELKFAGPKPIISHTGIEFDNNKEDKYVYLNVVVQLLKALDHDYIPEKRYIYPADATKLSDEEVMETLTKYCGDLEKIYETVQKEENDYVDEQIEHAKNNHLLNEEEREVLIRNISMMRTYMVRRAVNKKIYYCAIGALAEILKRDHIDYIVAPMFQKYAHIFHSIQGVLAKDRFPIDTKLEIYEENGELFTKLDLIRR